MRSSRETHSCREYIRASCVGLLGILVDTHAQALLGHADGKIMRKH